MPEFLAAPKTKAERIPIVTVQDLIDAFAAYLPTVSDLGFVYRTNWIESDRELQNTTIHMVGDPPPEGGAPLGFRIYIEKAVRSIDARLWNTPFLVVVNGSSNYGLVLTVQVEPKLNRFIVLRRVVGFDNGSPIFDGDINESGSAGV